MFHSLHEIGKEVTAIESSLLTDHWVPLSKKRFAVSFDCDAQHPHTLAYWSLTGRRHGSSLCQSVLVDSSAFCDHRRPLYPAASSVVHAIAVAPAHGQKQQEGAAAAVGNA